MLWTWKDSYGVYFMRRREEEAIQQTEAKAAVVLTDQSCQNHKILKEMWKRQKQKLRERMITKYNNNFYQQTKASVWGVDT